MEQFALRAPRACGGDRVGFDLRSRRGRARFVFGLRAPNTTTASVPRPTPPGLAARGPFSWGGVPFTEAMTIRFVIGADRQASERITLKTLRLMCPAWW